MNEYDSEKAALPPVGSGSEASLAASAPRKGGLVGKAERAMDFLVEHGVEERGIQPRPVDVGRERRGITDLQERERLGWRTLLPQLAFWGALNTNILSVSTALGAH